MDLYKSIKSEFALVRECAETLEERMNATAYETTRDVIETAADILELIADNEHFYFAVIWTNPHELEDEWFYLDNSIGLVSESVRQFSSLETWLEFKRGARYLKELAFELSALEIE